MSINHSTIYCLFGSRNKKARRVSSTLFFVVETKPHRNRVGKRSGGGTALCKIERILTKSVKFTLDTPSKIQYNGTLARGGTSAEETGVSGERTPSSELCRPGGVGGRKILISSTIREGVPDFFMGRFRYYILDLRFRSFWFEIPNRRVLYFERANGNIARSQGWGNRQEGKRESSAF